MGIKCIDILLHNNRDVFYAGEVVTGVVSVEIAEGSEVPAIVVRFGGLAHCHWTETHTTGSGKNRHTHTRSYSASLPFFNMEQSLTTTEGKLRPGSYMLPFQFQLPLQLSTSLEGGYGYIRYRLEAQAPANWFAALFKAKAVKMVRVLQLIDTNLVQYRFPVVGRDTKTNCCCCCESGPLFIDAQTDRAAYCPGEIVTITANFQNQSSKKARPYAKLIQKRIFRAEGHVRSTTDGWELTPIGQSDGTTNVIGEGGSVAWNGIQFKLPECLPSVNCGIIDVSYHVEVGLDIPWAFDLEVYLPVIIGTIPFQGAPVVMQQQPLAVAASSSGQQPTGAYPWSGTGKQSGTSIHATAPPLPTPQAGAFDYSVPPPSYFASVFSSEKATLQDEAGGQDQAQAQAQAGLSPNYPPAAVAFNNAGQVSYQVPVNYASAPPPPPGKQ